MATRLPQQTYFGYGLGDFGQNILFQASFYLPIFYTEIIGIDAVWLGVLLLGARIWDGINDPLMGYLSQQNKSRWGTYRPFLLWGAIPLALSMFLLFYVPEAFGNNQFAYVIASYLFFGLAFTAFNVPYGTLTASMTNDYHERGKLTGYRMTFAMLGGIVGATLILPAVNWFGGGREGYAYMGACFGLIILLTSLGSFFSVKETHKPVAAKRQGFQESLQNLQNNRPFWLLCICFAACFAAYAVFASSITYYCQFVLGDKEAASWILLAVTGITAIMVPVWAALSPKLGKRMIFLYGAMFYIVAYLGLYFLPSFPALMIYPILAIHGIGNAAAVYTSWAILPDTIEYGQWKSGNRVEGMSYGIYGFFFKLGLGLGGALALWLLSSSGYKPQDVQPESVETMLSLLVSIVPMLLILISVASLWFYPITAKLHKEIREEMVEGRQ